MSQTDQVRIEINPRITPEQLFSFYEKNNICETGFGQETASIPLNHSSLIVAAFEGDELVGIARAMCDRLAAVIMEFCVALKYQAENLKYGNGSLVEQCPDLGIAIGRVLLAELFKLGATFVSYDIVENCEEDFYKTLGFEHNPGHLVYIIDRRPYVS